MLKLAKLWSQ